MSKSSDLCCADMHLQGLYPLCSAVVLLKACYMLVLLPWNNDNFNSAEETHFLAADPLCLIQSPTSPRNGTISVLLKYISLKLKILMKFVLQQESDEELTKKYNRTRLCDNYHWILATSSVVVYSIGIDNKGDKSWGLNRQIASFMNTAKAFGPPRVAQKLSSPRSQQALELPPLHLGHSSKSAASNVLVQLHAPLQNNSSSFNSTSGWQMWFTFEGIRTH